MNVDVHQLPGDFAAFGGRPVFAEPLHVGSPDIPNTERVMARIRQVLESGRLTNHGPQVQRLERELTRLTGTRHCIAVTNATVGLQIAARALNLSGEVIVPSWTFVATAHAMRWIGLTPIFADVDQQTQLVTPETAEPLITDRTSAILPVHLWGRRCDAEGLQELAEAKKLRVLYDASHALGCRYRGAPLGGEGCVSVFSLHATKFLHSCEGGIIATNSDPLAARCRRLRNFGITDLNTVSDVGTNGKMHELSAVVGLESLSELSDRLTHNRKNRQLYEQLLSGFPGLNLTQEDPDHESNCQYLVVEVDPEKFGLTRDLLLRILRAEGVFARSYFSPGCHRAGGQLPPTSRHSPRPRGGGSPLPVTEALCDTILQLPTGRAVGEEEINRIVGLLRILHAHADTVTRLAGPGGGQLRAHPKEASAEMRGNSRDPLAA